MYVCLVCIIMDVVLSHWQVAVGRRKHLNVFGNDYNTPDGTGDERWFIVKVLIIKHCFVSLIEPKLKYNMDGS